MALNLASHIALVPSTGRPGGLAFLLLQECLPNIGSSVLAVADCALASRAQ